MLSAKRRLPRPLQTPCNSSTFLHGEAVPNISARNSMASARRANYVGSSVELNINSEDENNWRESSLKDSQCRQRQDLDVERKSSLTHRHLR